jgi:hypothetical protein
MEVALSSETLVNFFEIYGITSQKTGTLHSHRVRTSKPRGYTLFIPVSCDTSIKGILFTMWTSGFPRRLMYKVKKEQLTKHGFLFRRSWRSVLFYIEKRLFAYQPQRKRRSVALIIEINLQREDGEGERNRIKWANKNWVFWY